MTDRAVSEVIAFVLIFSIVITSVGLLYTAGFGSITQIQESETDRSAERAFGAMAVALDDIQAGRGSQRAIDLELSGRTLSVNDSASLTARIDGGSPTTVDGALVYGRGTGTEIVYQSGAVIRSDGPDSQLVSRPPRFSCRDEHAVVSLVSIDGPSRSVSTDGSLSLVASGPREDESTIAEARHDSPVGSPPYNVTIDFGGSGYETAWRSYFEDEDGWSVSGTTAECTDVDTAYVRVVPLELTYRGI
ncbi:hypothetical protein L593_13610 [Salinarchaeum sp. Harcht-Bsk1]|uniref:DUF7289 family protein n=1 Tax=Salinarchaeum sp. Harcht-Bsk1 TaxID=1333523 RepID=UPI00034248D8|nr:hypothetical protein [Salinarchaeum sp. Harcht-Bsk1]AGN02661.1 hypothetical protein L593_13610 [Salinarchaeum sp. Harcht-Bsk1]